MKIIIAGAGAVGIHLSKLLSAENHDVILLDADGEKLNFSRNNLEMMTVVGSPTSLKKLTEIGVKDTDLFISVTPEEAVNITACMLAANMGAKKTFARIDNYEYLLPKNKEFFEKLGISAMVYPEMLAAKEIVSALKRPWVRLWIELCGGAIIVVGVKIRENAELIGKSLQDLSKDMKKYHIVAIKRGNYTIIPHGSDRIQVGDILFFTTTNEYVDEIIEITGKVNFQVKNVVIMGGSRIAIRTCQYLPDNVHIKLFEADKEKCHQLLHKLPKNVTVYNVDGRNVDLLKQEGVENSDVFVAVTGNSESNILACLVAKSLGVRKTVAEVENLDYIMMAESFNIGSIINKKLITVNDIYRFFLTDDISTVKSLNVANADVAEIVAKPNSKITKKQIKHLSLPKNIAFGGLIRNGQTILIDGDTQIEANDHVVVFCLDDALAEAEKLFK